MCPPWGLPHSFLDPIANTPGIVVVYPWHFAKTYQG